LTLLVLISQTPEMMNTPILNGMFIQNEFTVFVKVLIILGIIASLALAPQYLEEAQMARFEYPILVLFAGLGMMIMVSANNMLSLYMGLELQSLSLYVFKSGRGDWICICFKCACLQNIGCAVPYVDARCV